MRNRTRLAAFGTVLVTGLVLSCGEPTGPSGPEGSVAPVITFVRDTSDPAAFTGPLTVTARLSGPSIVDLPLVFKGTGGGYSGVWSGSAEKLKPGSYSLAIEAVAENDLQYFGSNAGFTVTAGKRATPVVVVASVVPVLPPPPSDSSVALRQAWDFPVVVGAQSYTLQASKDSTFPTAATLELTASTPQMTIALNDAGMWYLRARASILGASRAAAWSKPLRKVVVTSVGGRSSGTATSTPIVPGTVTTVTNRNIVPSGTESWHQIAARIGDTIYVTTTAARLNPASGLNTMLTLLRANATTVLATNDDATGLQTDSRVIAVAPATEVYLARVSAVGGSIGQYLVDVELRRLPAAPTSLTGTVVSSTSVALAWLDNASAANGDNESGYELRRCDGAGCTPSAIVTTTAADATGFTDSGLSTGQTYRYSLRAARVISVLNTGVSSTVGPVTVDLAPPGQPDSLVATTASGTQINLRWRDTLSTETGFEVQRCVTAGCSSFTPIASLGANTTTYQNTGVTLNASYSYRVRAVNAVAASGFSNIATATTILPVVPTGLTAATVSTSQIALQWTDNANNESGYEVERCTSVGCSVFTRLDSLGANITTYQNTGLAADAFYSYRVRAINAAGQSAFSNTAAANTSFLVARYELDGNGTDASGNGRTGTVSGAVATADRFGVSGRAMRFDGTSAYVSVPADSGLSDASLTAVTMVAWFRTTQAVAANAWMVAKGTDFQYNYSMFMQVGRPKATAWQFAGADHLLAESPSGAADSSWHQMVGVFREGVDGKLFVDGVLVNTDVTPVGAWNKGGPGPLLLGGMHIGGVPARFFQGDLDDVRIYRRAVSDAEAIALFTGSPPFTPAAPSNLAVSTVSTSRIDLAWVDGSANETDFRVERCTGIGCTSFALIASVGPNVTSYQDLSVASATHYEYRVSATNLAGASAYASAGTAVLRYTDAFAGTLGNWVERDPDNLGSWVISNGQLVGDYDIGCGSSGCNHVLLLLADSIQPANANWRMEIKSLRDTAQCCFNGGSMMSLGKFALWVADGEKEAFSIGSSWPGLSPPATYDSAYANLDRYPWANVGSGKASVPTWNTALPQTIVLEKRGNTYRSYFNGVLLYTVTRTFSTPPKIGFETYGRVRMDDFRLYLIP